MITYLFLREILAILKYSHFLELSGGLKKDRDPAPYHGEIGLCVGWPVEQYAGNGQPYSQCENERKERI